MTSLDVLDADEWSLLRRWSGGPWIEPMLATPTSHCFTDQNWLFERKLDGVRIIAGDDGSGPHLWSRSGARVDASYPEVVEELRERDWGPIVLDGEIVAFEGQRMSFARLQRRMHVASAPAARLVGVPVYFYVFDLLALGGVDLTGLALRTRKRLLRRCVGSSGLIRTSAHRVGAGERMFEQACARGWEGVLAKRADSPYRPGRSRDWLKCKCVADQEFVIGGFTEPRGSRSGFGALLVGYHANGRLHYAGKVGTGYDDATLLKLRARLDEWKQAESPFVDAPKAAAHWVRPVLVAQIAFTEWTGDGRLRHPSFLGLRRDKAADEVVRERGAEE